MDNNAIFKAIALLSKKEIDIAYIYDPSDTILEKFTKIIPIVVAAGGMVKNSKGKVLFIYRNDKWDLPKGKLEKGESIEEGAIREVEEETGVEGLTIKNYLKTTYHTFKRNGEYKLKKVVWFAMVTSYSGKLLAQKEEGITKVKWKGPRKTEKALKNSYLNIKLLFEKEYLL